MLMYFRVTNRQTAKNGSAMASHYLSKGGGWSRGRDTTAVHRELPSNPNASRLLSLPLRTLPRVPLTTGVSLLRSFFLGEIRSGLKISLHHAVFSLFLISLGLILIDRSAGNLELPFTPIPTD